MPGGVSSPVRALRAVGGKPRFVARANGPYVIDVDGRQYIDLVGSWGAAIVGHAHPRVIEALNKAAAAGISFGACCAAEQELAGMIVNAIPSLQMLRFVNSGTEATMSALRLARAVTQRDNIVKFIGGYHGHVDSLLVATGSGAAAYATPDSAGVPKAFAQTTLLSPYNDLTALANMMEDHASSIAAIIVEPIAGNMGFIKPAEGFLPGLRQLCDKHGCLLIFDEVMTGFRVGWGGYQNLYGLHPDITCLGKVIGGGMPVAAYGGSRELMSNVSPLGPMYQAGTLSGNPVAMAVGVATLTLCQEDGIYELLSSLSKQLTAGLAKAAQQAGVAIQTDYAGGLFGLAMTPNPLHNFGDAAACDHALYARFFHAMLNQGVWLPPSGYEAMFVSLAHDEAVIDRVCQAAAESFAEIAA